MQEIVEKILLSHTFTGDWLEQLKKELRYWDNATCEYLLQETFNKAIHEHVPVSVFHELDCFNGYCLNGDEMECAIYDCYDWYNAVALFGNEELFGYLWDQACSSDLEGIVGGGLVEIVKINPERLSLVISWLIKLTDLYEFFCDYILYLEGFDYVPECESVILALWRACDYKPHNCHLRKGGMVEKFFLSLQEDV